MISSIKVIIPASGIGSRFGTSKPKQFLDLNGRQILWRTISVFENMNEVNEIAVAVPPGFAHEVQNYGFSKVNHIVEGGKSRAHSVFAALQCISNNTDIVLIHDGVRPFITTELAMAVAEAAKTYGAAIACTQVTDTIKKSTTANKISETLNRDQLWSVQTPQGFTYDIIMQAYQQAEKDGILAQVTDDSALVERLNIPVQVVPSSTKNIKITTMVDLAIAKVLLEEFS